MRIAMIAPLEMRVPPVAYGGTELIVSLLTEELVRRGHDVTLYASGDSITSAKLIPGVPRFLRGTAQDKGILNMLNVVACLEEADQYDIIHNHTSMEGMAAASLVRTPMLTTLHGNLEGDWLELFSRYTGWYNTISRSAAAMLPPKERFAGVIQNAIDVPSYRFNANPREDFLLFLSRMSPEKGPHLAIEAARRLGRRLILAGNVDGADEEYFNNQILPEIDGDLVRYIGEADFGQKQELLSRASCLLAPLTWAEPFGLFMIEAQACGTPVIALNRGAAAEVVCHGQTGFVVGTIEEMADAVARVREISPWRCRAFVQENFNVQRMADKYLNAYGRIIDSSALPVSTGNRKQRSPSMAILSSPANQAPEMPKLPLADGDRIR